MVFTFILAEPKIAAGPSLALSRGNEPWTSCVPQYRRKRAISLVVYWEFLRSLSGWEPISIQTLGMSLVMIGTLTLEIFRSR
jgi:hypothetical protein